MKDFERIETSQLQRIFVLIKHTNELYFKSK